MGNVFPEKEKGIPSPVFTPGRSHGQRSLVDYGPWGHKESDTTEQLSTSPRSDEDVCARTAPWKRILLNMEHEIGCVFNRSPNVLPEMPPTGGQITVGTALLGRARWHQD